MDFDALQRNKSIVWLYWMQTGQARALADEQRFLIDSMTEDVAYHGFEPIGTLTGPNAIYEQMWVPLRTAIPDLKRAPSIFFGGFTGEQAWVCGMGQFNGTFTADWLGIPATGEAISVRFGEFYRIEERRIVEMYQLLDVVDVMRQAGYQVLPADKGDPALFPVPMDNNGMQHVPAEVSITETSETLVRAMLFDGLNTFDGENLGGMAMGNYWDAGMRWYGPAGIGGCHSLTEFQQFHQQPFLTAFPDRQCTPHEAIIAEGQFVGAVGFPGVVGTHNGEYLGTAPTGNPVQIHLMDFWYRAGDKLTENWVFIDMPHLFKQMDVDLFARLQSQVNG